MWLAVSGTTLTPPTCIVYAAWLLTTDIASQTWKFPIVGAVPIYAIYYSFGYLSLVILIVAFQASIPLW
jgi:hypothetical protein